MDETDAALVLGVRRGDHRALEALVERYLRVCRSVALAVTRNEADAEDVCQDALVVAIERIDDCRDPGRFGRWLLQIVRNRARNAVRSRRSARTTPLDEKIPMPGASPARDAERSDLRERLLSALATVSEVEREIVLLHDLEGWKHAEIANQLGLPVGTVRSHLHHARRQLREILDTNQ